MQQLISQIGQNDSDSTFFKELLQEDHFICAYQKLCPEKQILCQLCFKNHEFDFCLQSSLFELQSEVNRVQKLQTNAQKRIKNELYLFENSLFKDIKLFNIQLEGGTILQNAYLIFMKGGQGTLLEGGIYPFLVQYPTNYPLSPYTIKSLFHFYHPILQNQQLCVLFNPNTKTQTKSIHEIALWHYGNLHDFSALDKIYLNRKILDIYDEQFKQMQATYFSFQNPIYQKWQLEQKWNQNYDEPIHI